MSFKQYAQGNINNIKRLFGNIIINTPQVVVAEPTVEPVEPVQQPIELINEEQFNCINKLADHFALFEIDLLDDPKNNAPLIKSIAFKAAGVKSLREIPSSQYSTALQAVCAHIHKKTKPCYNSAK